MITLKNVCDEYLINVAYFEYFEYTEYFDYFDYFANDFTNNMSILDKFPIQLHKLMVKLIITFDIGVIF